jgi:AcrR family transcriptional regulator
VVRPAHTARSERTRDALRRVALVRFLAQGVEDTSAEQIAADAGVSLRTFYRHFTSKHDLLFADYDAGLEWFRAALQARSPDEPILQSVQSAIDASPYDPEAVAQIAALRAKELDAGRIVRHTRQVEAEFADAIADQLLDRGSDDVLFVVGGHDRHHSEVAGDMPSIEPSLGESCVDDHEMPRTPVIRSVQSRSTGEFWLKPDAGQQTQDRLSVVSCQDQQGCARSQVREPLEDPVGAAELARWARDHEGARRDVNPSQPAGGG